MENPAAAVMQLEVSKNILHVNLEGITHEESLVAPEAGGNCLNWIVGHLVTAYDQFLPAVGAERVWSDDQAAPYRRGSDPIDPGQAMPLDTLRALYEAAHTRLVEKAIALGAEELSAPAPYSPGNNPEETVGSLLNLTAFHQAYHVGQTGILRRVVGRAGAIK